MSDEKLAMLCDRCGQANATHRMDGVDMVVCRPCMIDERLERLEERVADLEADE